MYDAGICRKRLSTTVRTSTLAEVAVRTNVFDGENKPTIPLAIENFSSVEGFDVYASILRESENDVKRGTEGADNPEEEEEKEQEKVSAHSRDKCFEGDL
uniref:Uncharacterized protein n=1 Tax=Ascaris lumbricoides TaxID=6252 RepID=A0A0M3I2A1_ASCLU